MGAFILFILGGLWFTAIAGLVSEKLDRVIELLEREEERNA